LSGQLDYGLLDVSLFHWSRTRPDRLAQFSPTTSQLTIGRCVEALPADGAVTLSEMKAVPMVKSAPNIIPKKSRIDRSCGVPQENARLARLFRGRSQFHDHAVEGGLKRHLI
jgi:hypothetical protein